jgi:hypothetical protein
MCGVENESLGSYLFAVSFDGFSRESFIPDRSKSNKVINKLLQAVALLLFAIPLWAHHATAAQYDVSATITLKGTISRIDWTNPHIHVYIDVKMENGNPETWAVEFPSPGAIIVAGLSRQLLVPGTPLTLEAYPSKPAGHDKGQRAACAKAITLSDGNRFAFVVGI